MTTVLVAEDDATNQAVLKGILSSRGYTPVLVNNGAECLAYLRTGKDPDLLLLDLVMPEVSGLDVLRDLDKDGLIETLPTVVLSAKNEQPIIKKALTLGAWDYVLKPFRPEDLVQRLTDLIFQIDHLTLQAILSELRFPDKKLLAMRGLQRHSDKTNQAYLTTDRGKPICVIVPFGQTPAALAKLALDSIEQQVWIYRKCAFGWRKVWPRWPVS